MRYTFHPFKLLQLFERLSAVCQYCEAAKNSEMRGNQPPLMKRNVIKLVSGEAVTKFRRCFDLLSASVLSD